MEFSDAANILPAEPMKDLGEDFRTAWRAVASGKMTVDEAWQWLKSREKPTIEKTDGFFSEM